MNKLKDIKIESGAGVKDFGIHMAFNFFNMKTGTFIDVNVQVSDENIECVKDALKLVKSKTSGNLFDLRYAYFYSQTGYGEIKKLANISGLKLTTFGKNPDLLFQEVDKIAKLI